MIPSIYRNSKDDTIMVVQNVSNSSKFFVTKHFVDETSHNKFMEKEELLNHIETYGFEKMKLNKAEKDMLI